MPSIFAVDVLKSKKRKLEHGAMEWIPAGTSNICERLSRKAKFNLGDWRHRLTPMHVEGELFYT